MTTLTSDQQRLAHAIRALAADPSDRATRTRVHDAGQRLTQLEIIEVLDSLPDAVVGTADLTRWTR